MANKGAFKKGHKGVKPKGSVSKKTLEWNNLGSLVTEKGAGRVFKIMDKAPDPIFLDIYFKLLSYFKPQLARTDVNQNNTGEQVIIIKRGGTGNYAPRVQSSSGTDPNPE